jgi:hypothetical protein
MKTVEKQDSVHIFTNHLKTLSKIIVCSSPRREKEASDGGQPALVVVQPMTTKPDTCNSHSQV